MATFQQILRKLSEFWEKQGCIIHQPYDIEKGAGTSNPATFLRSLGPEPYRAAYVEPCRRPSDGRYGKNPNRQGHYFQYQVIMKPSPLNIQDLYLQSLEAIGFNLKEHDIRFVHDDWENPTIGAWGLGWEVWMDGMEVTQFTYFQGLGGQELKPITGEITYGIERLTTYLQKVDAFWDIQWSDTLTYGDIYLRNEVENSIYNFEQSNAEMWFRHFDDYEKEAQRLIQLKLPLPAFDFVMKAAHAFNTLDARGAISVSERTGYIGRIRDLAKQIAQSYTESRKELGYPLMDRFSGIVRESVAVVPKIAPALLKADPKASEDFLLEIGCEELPATFVPIGMTNLEKGLKQLLESNGITYKKFTTYGAPRRLTASIEGLALGKPDQVAEKKGPGVEQAFDSNGNLKQAGEGFFRMLGKDGATLQAIREGKVKDVEVRKVKDAEYLFATIHTPGMATAQILAEQLPSLILGIDFPKKMRWADLEIQFARPLRWIAALFGKEIVPFKVGELISDRKSWGHRQLSPGAFDIPHPKDYLELTKKHFVLADPKAREAEISAQLDTLEKKFNAKMLAKERVMPQVVNLVEWPCLTTASFNKEFLKIPKEVLISEMVEHQKYFPVAHQDGTLQNLFVITANIPPTDSIRHGNQKVLTARLSDGSFLYEQDLKQPLQAFNEKLKAVTFMKGLGSVYDKVLRLVSHVSVLHKYLPLAKEKEAERAAILCKADLASLMVYEFPELQGIMGHYYALAHKEAPEVAQAIEEHWMPRGENAPLPKSGCGILVSLSDKIDNLISCFSLDLKPTSSSDPYALRRQTLGIIKTLIAGKHRLPLVEVIRACSEKFKNVSDAQRESLVQDIQQFIANRIRTVFLDYGFSKDEIEASLSSGFNDVYDTFCRVEALNRFRKSSVQFPLLYEVYKRAKGQIEVKQNGQNGTFSSNLLIEKPEQDLDKLMNQIEAQFDQSMKSHSYDQAYQLIAQIQPALAELFDKVKILADDQELRKNRLALLQRVFNLFGRLIDFSKIQA